MTKFKFLLNSLIGVLLLLYPLAVYLGIQYFAPWTIAAILLTLLLIRVFSNQTEKQWNRVLMLIAIGYCFFAVWNNSLITLRFYPVLISLGLFTMFFTSLFYPPPVIERIARIQHPDLPAEAVIYTRKVTKVWCGFFIFNGLIAAYTAVYTSFAQWSLYNGLISYVLMGLLMAVEYLIRLRTQPHVR